MQNTYTKLVTIIDKQKIWCNEPMKNHTTFKIGGVADFLVKPETEKELKEIIDLCSIDNIPLFIMGNGSNLLVKDKGIRGIVICLGDNFSSFKIDGERVEAQSGILLSTLSQHLLDHSLSGFEFASGIPGTLGGGISMNAGAYGGELKDIVESVRIMDRQGNITTLSNKDMQFSYRKSYVTVHDAIILSAIIKLASDNRNHIKSKMDDFTLRRVTKQPLSAWSAGSTFKRPEGYFAGKLIEDCGLKGLQMNNVAVSELHSGFVINTGNGTCENVLEMISFIKARVLQKYGVRLEEEVKIIGE